MSGLLRYAPRHALDQAMTRGAAMLVIGFMVMLPFIIAGGQNEVTDEAAVSALRSVLETLGVFYALVASYSLIGGDIRHGYYRFMFAKPMSPVRYYAMSYAVATLVFVTAILATIGLFGVLVRPVWPGPIVGDVIVNYFLLSALVLVYSRVSNGDWLFAILTLGVVSVIRARWPAEESTFGQVLNVLLPPTDTGRLFPNEGGVNWEPLLHQLGYAAFLLVAVLVIVRKLPMGSAR